MTRSKQTSYQQGHLVERQYKSGTVFIGRYRVRNSARGWTEKSKTLEATTRKRAEMELDRILEKINDANGGREAGNEKFSALLETGWPNYLDKQNAKPSTRYSYHSIIENWIDPFFGDLVLEEIEKREVTDFMATLVKADLSAKYRRNVCNLLKLLFELAVEYDFVAASPISPKLHRPKVDQRKVKPFSVKQAVTILENVVPEYRAAVWTLALSGVRSGELLGLRWCDLNFVKRRISISQTVWRGNLQTTKTESSDRQLSMSEPLFQVLAEHRDQSSFAGNEDFVFCQADGRPMDPDSLRKCGIYPALKKAGVPFRKWESGCHAFRHLAATVVHRKTGSWKLAQEQLGHSTVSTTANIYTDVDEEDMVGAADALAQALGVSCGKTVVESASDGAFVH